MKEVYVGMAAIVEKDNKFLILKRSSAKDFAPNTWEVITGRLEAEENPVNGILREITEETNLKAKVIMPVDTGFFYRGGKEFPMVFIAYYCKYISGEVKTSWEHTEHKWASIEEILEAEDLKHFHTMFRNIKNIKEYIPEDFSLEISNLRV